jgi:Ca2+-binding EF-hand superfamily protein
MTRFVGLLMIFAALALLLGTSSAGDGGKKNRDIEAIFKKLDVNMDGRLSKEEFLKIADKFRDKEKARTQLSRAYDKLDPDKKGLTQEQFRSFVETTAKKSDDPPRKTEK